MTADRSTREVDSGGLGMEVAGITDRGPVREQNQDVWDAALHPGGGIMLIALADGMGGHSGGLESATAAVDAAMLSMRSHDPSGSATLEAAVAEANSAVAGVRTTLGGHPGTTLVLAEVDGRRAHVANVGDSRAYLIRRGSASQITDDHTWVGEQIRAGALTPDEARSHPRRNMISRAVLGDPVEPDGFDLTLEPGDVLLLCSDGLWGPLPDAAIASFFVDGTALPSALERVCDAALGAGGTDNVTAAAARSPDGSASADV